MTDLEKGEEGEEELAHSVPNEDKLPHLHVITHRRNYIYKNIAQLP